VVGLYASILPLVGYAIFGSSRQLIVGPDAATLAILAASLSQISTGASEQQRLVVSAAFAIAVGVMCLLSGACRLGFIARDTPGDSLSKLVETKVERQWP
jgi:MFS superfamily sulfate permease-like transporter